LRYIYQSFFPAKPIGCFGDGGAVLTNSDELAKKIKILRVHGQNQEIPFINSYRDSGAQEWDTIPNCAVSHTLVEDSEALIRRTILGCFSPQERVSHEKGL